MRTSFHIFSVYFMFYLVSAAPNQREGRLGLLYPHTFDGKSSGCSLMNCTAIECFPGYECKMLESARCSGTDCCRSPHCVAHGCEDPCVATDCGNGKTCYSVRDTKCDGDCCLLPRCISHEKFAFKLNN